MYFVTNKILKHPQKLAPIFFLKKIYLFVPESTSLHDMVATARAGPHWPQQPGAPSGSPLGRPRATWKHNSRPGLDLWSSLGGSSVLCFPCCVSEAGLLQCLGCEPAQGEHCGTHSKPPPTLQASPRCWLSCFQSSFQLLGLRKQMKLAQPWPL